MSDDSQNNVLERRVSLPKPDVDNITVLSESLPNEPVLPWHHFDSPWLGQEQAKDQPGAESQAETDSETKPEEGAVQQLELELPESETTSQSAGVSGTPSAGNGGGNGKAEANSASVSELEGADVSSQESEIRQELDASR
ncbi:MAG: hypothetical protein AAFQ89_00825 [Cyanobacteria bacterium J06626_18]